MPETWETVGAVALLIAAIAGGVKGTEYLVRKLRQGGSWITTWWDERARKRQALAEIVDPKTWPNGSHTISDTINSLYETQATQGEQLSNLNENLGEVKLMVEDIGKSVENAIINGAARDAGEVG